jgi:hypothetical protein
MYIYDNISPNYSWNEKCFNDEEKIKTHILCSIIFPENRAVCENVKNVVETERPQMTI